VFTVVYVIMGGKESIMHFFKQKSTGIAYFPVIMQNSVKIFNTIPGDYNYNNSGTMNILLYAKDPASGPLRGTSGREFF